MKPSEDQISIIYILFKFSQYFHKYNCDLYKTLWHYFNYKHFFLTNSHVKKNK